MSLIKVLSFLVILPLNYSFNWNACKRWKDKNTNFVAPSAIVSSTTSFSSSFGPCAMIGKSDHDAKVFLVNNKERLFEDFAKGEGENAQTFASLYHCNHVSQKLFILKVRSKFSELVNTTDEEELFNLLRNEILSTGESCKPTST